MLQPTLLQGGQIMNELCSLDLGFQLGSTKAAGAVGVHQKIKYFIHNR